MLGWYKDTQILISFLTGNLLLYLTDERRERNNVGDTVER